MRNETIVRSTTVLACLFATAAALAGPSNPSRPSQRAADELFGVATLSAVVQSNGIFAGGVGGDTVARLSTGTYEVLFERDVQNCTYSANAGSADAGQVAFGVALVASRAGEPNGVWVQIRNNNGGAVDSDFHLIVFCGY
jgi:hypothetical protein